ncbi:uncharacterized protein LOC126802097 [Argentina anserina]|uniref:uncharacterized protein LOC126802097 n=1 Tax=Argentina anserina TaxID=57926 RepID=UPI0021768A90|nr:uncharacterized protein LOC126802097 [Potentilla anserina]
MEGESGASGSSGSKPRVRPDPFLVLCRCFSVITAFIALFCIVVNILSAIESFKDGADIFNGIFRCYAVLMAILVIVAETELEFITKFWKVFDYWVSRGMLQIFVAVMTRAFANEELILLQTIASYMLLACGVLYVILGILCIGCLKRYRQKKEISRDQAVKDREELERRKEELEYSLVEDRT